MIFISFNIDKQNLPFVSFKESTAINIGKGIFIVYSRNIDELLTVKNQETKTICKRSVLNSSSW